MPPKQTHTHEWYRVNNTLAQCRICEALKTVKPKAVKPPPGTQDDPDGMRGIRVRDAAEKYGMSKDAIYNAWKKGYIYRISAGLYDEVSLKKYVDSDHPYGHLRDTTKTVSFGPTAGMRVLVHRKSYS
jgi:hypothetical protein